MGLPLSAYRDALDVLFARTTGASKLGLERTSALLASLGDPHRRFPTFHIAGTNGKGSVAATLEALLRSRGHRVGTYTSPHLVDFRERITVDGVPIPPQAVVDFVACWLHEAERLGATFFEATTALAFDWLARSGVDVAVVETGLGGRLDATNVVIPLVAGVTSIGMDHEEHLGTTLEQIAAEKAGIFKSGRPAVIGEPSRRIRALLAGIAEERGAGPIRVVAETARLSDVHLSEGGTTFTLVAGTERQVLRTPLIGRHQAWNAAVALSMVEAAGATYAVPPADAACALASVSLAGRFQRAGRYLFDVAHNPSGAAVLADTLAAVQPERPVAAVLCVLGDKDWRGVMRALAPHVDCFVLTQAPTAPASRAWDPAAAGQYAQAHGWPAQVVDDFEAALSRADVHGATILVTGSFHTVGDAMARLQVAPFDR